LVVEMVRPNRPTGAVVAGLVPLPIALPSIVVALGLVAVLAHAFSLSVFVINMLTGMGLALAIDYALCVVSRFREERAGAAPSWTRSTPPQQPRIVRSSSAARRS